MPWERRRFLIVVKTYPNPSAKLQEVVCTAAIRDDGALVRLFPIPFRTLDEGKRFPKWTWVEANVIKAANDPRPESFKIDATSIDVIETIPAGKSWPKRWQYIEPLLASSVEGLVAAKRSLGIIKPGEYDLIFEDEDAPSWTADERSKLTAAEGAIDLFGSARPSGQLLEKLPVRIQYRYRCADPRCTGHQALFEDWEVGESWRSWRRIYKTRQILEEKLRERYVLIPRRKDNLYLFVGTHSRYPVWLVIGHVQPQHLANEQIP